MLRRKLDWRAFTRLSVKKDEKRKNKGGAALQERSRFLDLKRGCEG